MTQDEKIIDSFLEYLRSNKYSEATVSSYYFSIKDFSYFINKNNKALSSFIEEDIVEYCLIIKENSLSQTANSKMYALVKFVEYINKDRKVKIKYSYSPIKIKNKRNVNSIHNIESILEAIEANEKHRFIYLRNRLLLLLLYHTGLRTKELLKLKKENIQDEIINFSNSKLIVNKKIAKEIKDYIGELDIIDNQFLFFTFAHCKKNYNQHLTEKSVEDLFNKYCKMKDNNFSILDLRNSLSQDIYSNIINQTQFVNLHSHKEIITNLDFLSFYSKNKVALKK